MIRLKDRNRQIPNGLGYYLPQTKWRAHSGSFENVSQQLQRHLQGNAAVAKQLRVGTDIESARVLVDYFNAKICQANGWTDYYLDDTGQSPPKTLPRGPVWSAKSAVAAGVGVLGDWLGAGGQPVAPELANSRASVCAGCPRNDKNQSEHYVGDWTKYFTQPASAFIRKQFEKRLELKLTTHHDEEIEVCSACLCPLKLKVHCPIEHIKNRMPEAVRNELHDQCWVLQEIKV